MKRTQNPEKIGEIVAEVAILVPWPITVAIAVLALALATPWILAKLIQRAHHNGSFDAVLPVSVKARRDDKVWAGWDEYTRRFARAVDPERWDGR